MVTPTKQTSAEKKLVVDRDILKERSPQPQRYSPKDHKLSSGGKKLSSSPVLTSADRRAIQVAQVMHEESKEESKGVVEVEEPEQYDEVYQMYKEMASLIRDGMPASDSENGSNQQLSEENKQSAGSDEEDDDEDDDFGTDRDIDWKDAR